MMDVFPLPKEQKDYTYSNSQQISMQTGLIGHLRADFGSYGNSFYSTWFDFRRELKSEEFKQDLDDVINALRDNPAYGGMLKNRSSMSSYGWQHPETTMQGNYCPEHFVRVNTDHYAFLLRMNPTKGDYNLYCYCYDKQWLDRHLDNARQGIRFIYSNYQNRFIADDGDKVRVVGANGLHTDYIARFVDPYHLEFGNNLYHICELAEILERNGTQAVIPLRNSLPDKCYTVAEGTASVAVIEKGKPGYVEVRIPSKSVEEADSLSSYYNKNAGVTPAQFEAMKAGSMFGWEHPAADPKNYDENGLLFAHKSPNRGDAR